MNEDHKNLCEKIYELSREMLKDKGHVSPAFFILQDDKVILLSLPKELDQIQDDDLYKRMCFETAQIVCEQMKGEALIHITEALIAQGSKEEMDNYKGRLSEHPKRKESIILIYISSTGERTAFVGHLVQLSDSNERTLEEGKWIDIKELPLSGDIKPCNALLQ